MVLQIRGGSCACAQGFFAVTNDAKPVTFSVAR